MIDPLIINGKRLAMLAWGENADGSDDVAVFSGVAQWNGIALTMRREPETVSFVIPAEWLSRIEPVAEELKEALLNADYSFSVIVGNVDPAGEETAVFSRTGLKWPST